MNNFEEIRKKASTLRQNQNFAEALPLFKKLWEKDDNKKWDGWGYALCLRKLGKSEESIQICEEVLKDNNNFDYIKNVYVWSIFDYLSQKGDSLSIQELIANTEKIINNSSKQDLIYTKSIFKVINKLKENPNYHADIILNFIDKLDINNLSKTPYSFEQNGKKIEMASEYEQYFMHKTKALYELKQYEKCIEACNLALNSINNFHYNNDIWFKWRIALSYKELKKYDAALNNLQYIVKIKKDWFIQHEIAVIYYILKNYEKALSFALQGILNFGEIDKKIHLLILLAEIFEAKQMEHEAKLHFVLAKSIINENKWGTKLPSDLSKKYGNFHLNKLDILNKLKNVWEEAYFSNKQQYIGVISSYLPNKKAGFIMGEDNKTYYFKISELTDKKEKFCEGTKVVFYLEDSFDAKKNKPVKNAVKIKIASCY
ncbi:MAG: hypothetical protein JG767_2062 [Deferribacteraceae bacterium]|jgi:tetratricopeptide (TPR) repeat protein|nr:hypothetical protein [Deferribacteraceae bacterium]